MKREVKETCTCRKFCLKVFVRFLNSSVSTILMGLNHFSRLGISSNFLQLARDKLNKFKSFDGFDILSSSVQLSAYRKYKLAGKSGIDLSFLQPSKMSCPSFKRPPRLGGRLSKLLHPKSKISRVYKLQTSVGIALPDKLHFLRRKSFSVVDNRLIGMRHFLGNIQDQKSEGNDSERMSVSRDFNL
jgi:hypothetical protein